jgi:hypothetical protein
MKTHYRLHICMPWPAADIYQAACGSHVSIAATTKEKADVTCQSCWRCIHAANRRGTWRKADLARLVGLGTPQTPQNRCEVGRGDVFGGGDRV